MSPNGRSTKRTTWSWWNGTSRWAPETRLSDTSPQLGHVMATPITVGVSDAGATSFRLDGNTGFSAASRLQ